ncbi:unnamed protein product [Eruca vesicaria subsp. sativa]|uniref:Uncharacterized protein n=1 Tax=Eruca vesicaria subsp. sativa TaxID=29727 RepID=A0ABC8KGK4_ERUVS|nr:unnamed protein product [Eruca vesicaria subsp. sativa]
MLNLKGRTSLNKPFVDVKGNSFLDNMNRSKEAEKPSFTDLPLCLLEITFEASAVCRTWCEAGLYVQLVDKPPPVMCLPKRGNLFELYDPLQQKTYTLNLPEIVNSTVCYAQNCFKQNVLLHPIYS